METVTRGRFGIRYRLTAWVCAACKRPERCLKCRRVIPRREPAFKPLPSDRAKDVSSRYRLCVVCAWTLTQTGEASDLPA